MPSLVDRMGQSGLDKSGHTDSTRVELYAWATVGEVDPTGAHVCVTNALIRSHSQKQVSNG